MTPITEKNITMHELIGLEAEVVEDSNPHVKSISGTVVDESRNTISILHEGETKRVVKKGAVIRFRLPDHSIVDVDGAVLVGRPEDRAKRKMRRSW